MKSIIELQSMLASEICNNFLLLKERRTLYCYNEIMGDSSFLLSGILERELENDDAWSSVNWIDDSLIHKVDIDGCKVRIWGVMIWGKDGTTKQWTDPFYCELTIDCKSIDLQELTILFGDVSINELIYEEFSDNRDFWDRAFYSDTYWTPSEREWKYKVHSKKMKEDI